MRLLTVACEVILREVCEAVARSPCTVDVRRIRTLRRNEFGLR